MWHTSEGDRTLTGAEARLFKCAVLSLVEFVRDESDDDFSSWNSGIALFDDLIWSQKLAVLETVTSHLICDSGPMPGLTAVNEAAIGAIFEYVSFETDLEIDDRPAQPRWRTMVLDACRECLVIDSEIDAEFNVLPTDPLSQDRHNWHAAVQLLADRILWDRDYEMMGEFLDEPPEKAALLRQIMGIDDDYFAAAAEDLNSPKAVVDSLTHLEELLN